MGIKKRFKVKKQQRWKRRKERIKLTKKNPEPSAQKTTSPSPQPSEKPTSTPQTSGETPPAPTQT